MTTWREVRVGDVVLGRDKHGWTVTHRKRNAWVVKRTGKLAIEVTPSLGDEVTILHRPKLPEDMDEAVTVVTASLGGLPIAHEYVAETGEKTITAPLVKDMPDPGVLAAHVYSLHGDRTGGLGRQEIKALHSFSHERGTRCADYVNHLHIPDFYLKQKT